MSQIWFSADSHYGHKNIIEYCERPFSTVAEMDAALIENWNEVVSPEDKAYFLGDFSLDFKFVKQVVPLLNGKLHLIAGNHDLCHPCHSSGRSYISKYREAGFFDVMESTMIDVADQVVLCHHLPYFDSEDIDQRYPEFKPNDEGGWLLHGHVHERWKIRNRQINVGVDVWDFYPVSIDNIASLIAAGDTHDE